MKSCSRRRRRRKRAGLKTGLGFCKNPRRGEKKKCRFLVDVIMYVVNMFCRLKPWKAMPIEAFDIQTNQRRGSPIPHDNASADFEPHPVGSNVAEPLRASGLRANRGGCRKTYKLLIQHNNTVTSASLPFLTYS